MSGKIQVVAILTESAALSSILAGMLASRRGLRVRQFESSGALVAYMRIAPVDLVVSDTKLAGGGAVVLASRLRGEPHLARADFQIIALTRQITPELRRAAIAGGIDEVIVKPMSPRYLEERVAARLARTPRHIRAGNAYAGPERRGRLPMAGIRQTLAGQWPSNVVPLFGNTANRRAGDRPGIQ